MNDDAKTIHGNLSAYEERRLKNMKRNEALLVSLGIQRTEKLPRRTEKRRSLRHGNDVVQRRSLRINKLLQRELTDRSMQARLRWNKESDTCMKKQSLVLSRKRRSKLAGALHLVEKKTYGVESVVKRSYNDYLVVVQKGARGWGMKLAQTKDDRIRVKEYHNEGSDSRGPIEATGLVELGDDLLSIDGVHVKDIDAVLSLLKDKMCCSFVFRRYFVTSKMMQY
jgi:hypothetical protein